MQSVVLLGISSPRASAQAIPVVGQAAPDFRLPALSGEAVQLSRLTPRGPVVLVILRGFPGYQCPACNAQTGQLLASAAKFAEKKAQVVLVYPGSPPGLAQRAKEFANDKAWPVNFHLVVDQDYALTNLYGLRWNAPNETAYPSTFVVDGQGKIVFAKISKSHGGRTSVGSPVSRSRSALACRPDSPPLTRSPNMSSSSPASPRAQRAIAWLIAVTFGGQPIARFTAAATPVWAIAASTQSSLASLPAMLEAALRGLQIPPRVADVILPLAVAIFRFTSPVANLAVCFFIAHLYNLEPSLIQIISAIVVADAVSIAAVGLPQVSFIASIAPICLALGVPTEVLGILIAVEVIPDIFRTLGNVTGDLAATSILARNAPREDEGSPAP